MTKAKSPWISTKDKQPKFGVSVVGADPYSSRPYITSLSTRGWWDAARGDIAFPTHWMPIPPLPEGER